MAVADVARSGMNESAQQPVYGCAVIGEKEGQDANEAKC